jgi:hypothetical protein
VRRQKEDAMDTIGLPEQVIEFFGELYLHEPAELRGRVQFRDYIGLLSRNMHPNMPYDPLHAHRCVCGTFLLCRTPASKACAHSPCCRDCGSLSLNGNRETHHPGIKARRPSEPSVATENRSSSQYGS